MEKINLEEMNDSIKKLQELFPNAFMEDKIDFDVLRALLGDNIDSKIEKYQFTWNGKLNTIKSTQKASTGTLIPDRASSKNWDRTENLYIEGDNLEVLKLLSKTYANKIGVIYIDPPYNTGNDFVYRDEFSDSINNYKKTTNQSFRTNPETNGRYHTDWLNMIYPRLLVSRNLLADEGVICISIDDNEVHNLRKICDEIFGEINFVEQIAVEITKTQGMKVKAAKEGSIVKNHEYVLIYTKTTMLNKRIVKNILFDKGEDFDSHYSFYLENPSDKIIEIKSLSDALNNMDLVRKNIEDIWGNRLIKNSDIEKLIKLSPTFKNILFNILAEKVFQETACDINVPEQIYDSLRNDSALNWNGYLLKKTSGGKIRQFISLKDSLGQNHEYNSEYGRVTIRGDLWKGFYSDMMNVAKEGDIEFKNGKKPIRLIKQLIYWLTDNKNSIILDYFSGSATTAHAVMQLNAEDGGDRKFIMVQLPELTEEKSESYKAGYKNICEIGKERIRRAGDMIVNELNNKQNAKTLLDEKSIDPKKLDIGFKVFKLESSNFTPFEGTKDGIQASLELETMKIERTEYDILYEIMSKYGVFDKSVKEITIDGMNVFSVGSGFLIVCLSKSVNEATINKIAELKPRTVIFDETGFPDDNAKDNAVYILHKAGVEEVKSI